MDVAEREDVIHYLQTNLEKFSVEELRQQLASEGVTEAEFNAALTTTQRKKLNASAPAAGAKPKPKRSARAVLARLLLVGGAICIVLGLMVALNGRSPEKATGPSSAPEAPPAASAYVGRSGYVIRLPDGYQAIQSFKGEDKRIEVVHFCKAGLDPTSLLDEGLYGPLGIVRLEVQPNPFSSSGAAALEPIVSIATGKAQERGEHFTLKNLQIGSLSGVQLNFDVPNPRVVSYVVGQSSLYTFYAGQDDELYRGIINSLRDTQSE